MAVPNFASEENTALFEMRHELEEFLGSSYRSLSRNKDNSVLDQSADLRNGSMRLSERIADKTRLVDLEGQLSHVEVERKRQRIDYDLQVSNLRLERDRSINERKEHEERLNGVLTQRETVKRELADAQRENLKMKQYLQAEIDRLKEEKRKQMDDLQLKLIELQSSEERLKSDLFVYEQKRLKSEGVVAEMELEMERLNKQNGQLKNESRDCAELRVNEQKLKNEIRDMESRLKDASLNSESYSCLKSELGKMAILKLENERLAGENKKLMAPYENIALLKEQISTLKLKQENFHDLRASYCKLEWEKQRLDDDMKSWKAMLEKMKVASLDDLLIKLSELQRSEAFLVSSSGELRAKLSLAENKWKDAKVRLDDREAALVRRDENLKARINEIQQLTTKINLLVGERDAMKKILSSYERAEQQQTMDLGVAEANRVQQLELINDQQQKRCSELEMMLQATSNELGNMRAKCNHLESKVRALDETEKGGEESSGLLLSLREKIASLEKDREMLVSENEELKLKVERNVVEGGFDSDSTKVLHFNMNPADLARKRRLAELDKLASENEKLRERIKIMEEDATSMANLTQQMEDNLASRSSKEIHELKGQIERMELKNKRLLEVFSRKTQEVREAIYQLLGYKLDFPTDKKYRLQSMYSESCDDFLVFEQSPNGEMQLLDSKYSQQLADLARTYLRDHGSIPAFLASLTNNLFSRQTLIAP